ncbi:hypothetical protein HZS_1926, partial [Henneguya salminicola]
MGSTDENLLTELSLCLAKIHEEYDCPKIVVSQSQSLIQLSDLLQQNHEKISSNLFLSKIAFLSLLPYLYSKASNILYKNLKIVQSIFINSNHWKFMMAFRYDILFNRILIKANIEENECKIILCILGKTLKICPNLIPLSILNCLCNISFDIRYQNNSFRNAFIGILSYYTLKYPKSLSYINISNTLMECCLDCNTVFTLTFLYQDPFIIECCVTFLLYMYDDPNLRNTLFQHCLLEKILAPFTDRYFFKILDSRDNFEDITFKCCSFSLIGLRFMLRSWTGIFLLFNSEKGIKSLFQVLPYATSLIQGLILNLLCDMFFIEYPDDSIDFYKMLSNLSRFALNNQIHNIVNHKYVVDEILLILKPRKKDLINVLNIYQGFIVQACVYRGLIESLLQTIFLTSEMQVKNTSIVVLAETLRLYYTLIAPDLHLSNHLECLLNYNPDDFIGNAMYFIVLSQSEIKNILSQINAYINWKNDTDSTYFITTISSILLPRQDHKQETKQIPDSKKTDDKSSVPYKDSPELVNDISACRGFSNSCDLWSWEKIRRIFYKYKFIYVGKASDQPSYKFCLALKEFYIPSRNNFFSIQITSPIAKVASEVAFLFFKCLLSPNQSNDGLQWVNEFLISLTAILSTYNPMENVTISHNYSNSKHPITFSELYNSINDCLCREYFALIGFIQGFKIGQAFIDASLVLNKIYTIFESSHIFRFIRAVIPCMNYRHPLCQRFIGSLTHSNDFETKVFLIKFMRTYARLNKNKRFLLNYLITMIYDLDQNIQNQATDALDEILNGDMFLCGLIADMNLPYFYLKSAGIKILSRIISTLSMGIATLKYLNNNYEYLAKEWCTSNYGSTSKGVRTLLQHNPTIIQNIVEISYNCPHLSVRWIALIGLNIIRKNSEGTKILNLLDWKAFNNNYFPWFQQSILMQQTRNINSTHFLSLTRLNNNPELTPIIKKPDNIESGVSTFDVSADSIKSASVPNLEVERSLSTIELPSALIQNRQSLIRKLSNQTKKQFFKTVNKEQCKDQPNEVFSYESLSSKKDKHYTIDFRENFQVLPPTNTYICLPTQLTRILEVVNVEIIQVKEQPEKKKQRTRINEPLVIFEKNANELCCSLSKMCFSCSILLWSKKKYIFKLIPCEKFKNTIFTQPILVRGTKEDPKKSLEFLQSEDTNIESIQMEIITIIHNMVTDNMYASGSKILH